MYEPTFHTRASSTGPLHNAFQHTAASFLSLPHVGLPCSPQVLDSPDGHDLTARSFSAAVESDGGSLKRLFIDRFVPLKDEWPQAMEARHAAALPYFHCLRDGRAGLDKLRHGWKLVKLHDPDLIAEAAGSGTQESLLHQMTMAVSSNADDQSKVFTLVGFSIPPWALCDLYLRLFSAFRRVANSDLHIIPILL
jgi:hypothetical protein